MIRKSATTARLSYRALFFSTILILSPLAAEEPKSVSEETGFPPAQIEFFETEIRPLLADNCLKCHTGTKAKTGLQLQSRKGWLKGSDYRTVVDLENPEKSLIVRAVAHTGGKDVEAMPYNKPKLPDEAAVKLTEWIAMGLPWPKEDVEQIEDPTKHWSFQPVTPPKLPENAGHPIDHFIHTAQKKAGITPAPAADRATLYRRAHFDLLGLPPKYDEQQKFVNDPRSDDEAWKALVEHLLGSPHYGERWARHWMDVARYSDTIGYEAGGRERRFIYSYTYRDWLIHAFNEDLPYDQFLLYQLAAEQLVDWKSADKRHLAALGFITLSKNGRQELVVDDRLDTTFRGTMALTVACARCHDHKFDPISTKEYYGLYSVFQNSLEEERPTIGEPKEGPEYDAYRAELEKRKKAVEDFERPILAELAEKFPEIANREEQLRRKIDRETRREIDKLQKLVDKYIADSQMEPDKAIIVKDRETPGNQHVFIRGNPSRRGELAPRQFLDIATLNGEPKEFEKGSGRLEMAQAIADPANPLTARNIVNRVWMWHFGEGIVRSADDFGTQGEVPDHPELLDYLANWFVDNGWSIKKLHKLILTSETWRQQSRNAAAEKNMLVDAENRLLWKYERQRLDLEQMRDAVLDVAGNLSNEMYGRAVTILEPPYSNRRSVYAFIDRQNLNPVFRNFDFSNPQETTAKRPNTTIPMQALFTMNSDFVQDQSLLLAEKTAKAEDRVAALHRAVFASEPSESDRHVADSFLTVFEGGIDEFAARQTDHEWSYGWGSVDRTTGKVDFKPLPHWTGERWQMSEEWPFEHPLYRYLRADGKRLHPGTTSNECGIYEWRAPADLRIRIESKATRPAVGEGNGVDVTLVSSRHGIIKDHYLDPSKESVPMNAPELEVKEGDRIWFLVDSHEGNTSHDTVEWDPKIIDLDNRNPSWVYSVQFSGPLKPASAWSAYAHALLNTNRFLFVE